MSATYTRSLNWLAIAAAFWGMTICISADVSAQEWGSISGQLVLKGDIPPVTILVEKEDPNVKDAAICAEAAVPSDELVIDEETKGIANVFVYLYTSRRSKLDPEQIHPDLRTTPEDKREVVFDQKNCRFIPQALVVRTDQTVIVKSGDACAHNTHTIPLRNSGQNFILSPNDRVGVPVTLPQPESVPITVKCDLHSWMKAFWLVVDHPYATKTDAQGKFTIKHLPVGERRFRIWHERIGYIDRKLDPKNTKYELNVGEGELKLDPIEVPVEWFTQDS